MLVADAFRGNVDDDPDLAARVDAADALTVTVDGTERRRSRVRTTADDGTELGVVVGRELRSGDVLSADGTLVLVELEPVAAMVIDLGDVDSNAAAVTAALELGHAVGNRHWDLAVDGDRAYLPLTDSRERTEREVRPHLPDGATVEYEEVPPALFDEGDAGHSHGGDDHAHSHGEGSHAHSHGSDAHGVREIDTEDRS